MTFEELKEKIGPVSFAKLAKEAEKEVALSLQMDLLDEYGKKKYYRQRSLLSELLEDMELFEKLEIKILPVEVIDILFRCKLIFAVKSFEEYEQRAGSTYFHGYDFIVPWSDKSKEVEVVIDESFKRRMFSVGIRTIITEINEFDSQSDNLQEFFDKLFTRLNLPFVGLINREYIIEKYKIPEDFALFNVPAIGYSVSGSETYTYYYAMAHLRTFLNLLRIIGFVNSPQADFGQENIKVMAPVAPVTLGTNSFGGYCWEEGRKKPWEKIPDGSLFLSFGYRSLSRMWLDNRCWESLEKSFVENNIIFECLKNPWSKKSIYDISPSLDILSSATQISDLGAKTLLIYCCLEHLFVPGVGKTDNKIYIVGGINALKPGLLPWFYDLYELRCSYAHKGFVLQDSDSLIFIFESIRNVLSLLNAKLSISEE